jgi:DNA-binding transcriptional regulator YiaG
VKWDGPSTRALRRHLGFTQEEMGAHLGVRQQTISEWETGVYAPRGGSVKLLDLVAKEHGFEYQENAPEKDDDAE